MNIEIINTGSELMLGRVLNTHQQWLCRQLSDLGYAVTRQVAVADTGIDIKQAVQESLAHVDIVICTGGLGPTSDDLTRNCIAEMLGKKLVLDLAALENIQTFYASRNRPMPASTQVQALAPEGAIVLQNAFGTAPGLVMELMPNPFRTSESPALLVMLPGPPRELYPMFTRQVIRLLQEKYPLEDAFASRTFKTTGFGESVLEEKLAESLDSLIDEGLELGYCARVGEVEVRLGARGPGAMEKLDSGEKIIRNLLGACIFGMNDDTLEGVIINLLTARNQTVALAESCTGGFIAHRLTNVPGASAVVMAGLVTYSNESKQRLLGVPEEIIKNHGAVSEAVARAMAEGARQRNNVDYALAVTGIAGPTGGTPDKPVGTVYIALATAKQTVVQCHLNRFERLTFKIATAQQALDLLRQNLLSAAR